MNCEYYYIFAVNFGDKILLSSRKILLQNNGNCMKQIFKMLSLNIVYYLQLKEMMKQKFPGTKNFAFFFYKQKEVMNS